MPDPHPAVARAAQALGAMDGQDSRDRVAALEDIAASLDSALSDRVD